MLAFRNCLPTNDTEETLALKRSETKKLKIAVSYWQHLCVTQGGGACPGGTLEDRPIGFEERFA